MANRKLQYAAIFLTCFIDILGFGIVIPVLPLYGEHFGATAMQIGALVGIFSLAQFICSPLWGKMSDRVGRKPVLLIGLAGTVAGYLIMGLAGSVAGLFIGRLIDGVAGANISAAQAYLADISSKENRAKAMGVLGAAFGLGFVFGPVLGGIAGKFNYALPMYIAAGLAAVNFFFVVFCLPESRVPGTKEEAPEKLFPNMFSHIEASVYWRTLASYFLVIAGFSMMTTVFAQLLWYRYKLDVLHTGFVLGGIGILGVIIQGGLIGRLVRIFGEQRLALSGAFFMSFGLAALAFTEGMMGMILASAAIGIGNSLLMPTLSALASRSVEADWQGRALGVMQSSGSLARFLGPNLAGLLQAVQFRHAGASPYAFWPILASALVVLIAAAAVVTIRPVRADA